MLIRLPDKREKNSNEESRKSGKEALEYNASCLPAFLPSCLPAFLPSCLPHLFLSRNPISMVHSIRLIRFYAALDSRLDAQRSYWKKASSFLTLATIGSLFLKTLKIPSRQIKVFWALARLSFIFPQTKSDTVTTAKNGTCQIRALASWLPSGSGGKDASSMENARLKEP